MWIGGTDAAAEGQYKWADGEAFTWPDFITDAEPGDSTAKNCLVETGFPIWVAAVCSGQHAVLCEMDAGELYLIKGRRGRPLQRHLVYYHF